MTADLLAQVCAEIDARLAELRPAVDEYERLLGAADALEADAAPARATPAPATPAGEGDAGARPARAATPRSRTGRRARARSRGARSSAARGPAEEAIVAALEHGSHTVSELVLVTAMAGPEIRDGLRGLQRAGRIARAQREGRTAYALSGTA